MSTLRIPTSTLQCWLVAWVVFFLPSLAKTASYGYIRNKNISIPVYILWRIADVPSVVNLSLAGVLEMIQNSSEYLLSMTVQRYLPQQFPTTCVALHTSSSPIGAMAAENSLSMPSTSQCCDMSVSSPFKY
jgi:hypothetical protein